MELIDYLLKVNVAIILFYGFYRLFFQQDTFFQWKRAALISIVFISLLYPFVDITRQLIANHNIQEAINNGIFPSYSLSEVIIEGKPTGQHVPFLYYLPQVLFALYGIVAGSLLIRILIQTGIIIGIVNCSQRMELYGQTVYKSPGLKSPFSFFNWILLDPGLYTETELKEILWHEETHVRQRHSIDTLLSELLCVFCWFNPFAWLLKREIRMNLEFLADRSVLTSGCEAEHYQFHLLRLSYHKAAAQLSNNFNVSPLKKRIFMMNKKQTSNLSICKYALLLPLIAVLVFFNNCTSKTPAPAEVATETQEEQAVVNVETIDVIDPSTDPVFKDYGENVFSHVETPPKFPGGDKALMQWLNDNIDYPPVAQEQGIQGRVILRFVIDSDGSVTNVGVQRSLDPSCDKEAVRAAKKMPKWEPGKQNGETVPVYYTLPVMFKLQK
ncbi:cell envelope biogenesis protein TonB [Bacteroidia bacterium]|nr:cell envelope biogenesis protein TonB [Bacteroidia bacterium]